MLEGVVATVDHILILTLIARKAEKNITLKSNQNFLGDGDRTRFDRTRFEF